MFATLLLGLSAVGGISQAEDITTHEFMNPPDAARPAFFAFLMPYGAVPDAVITRDLEEMKAKGATTCLIYSPGPGGAKRGSKLVYGETENRVEKTTEYNGRGAIADDPGGAHSKGGGGGSDEWRKKMWSDEWRKTIRCAAREAGRLGLELGLSIGNIGCTLEALPLEYGEQSLLYSATEVKGAAKADVALPLAPKVPRQKDGTPLFYRDITVLALPARGDVTPAQVVDLSGKMDATGHLDWDAPGGDWVILRFGHACTNPKTIDHLSAGALDKKWEVTTGRLLQEMTPEERRGLKFLECDSYEGGRQTWTARFAEEFRRLRGYDIRPWLPVLAGRTVGDARQSACFQRDYQLTISDLYAENHYARHTALAKASGLKFYAEAAGPHQAQADLLKSISRCDVSMGEFWMPGTHRGVADASRFLLRDAAAAAHGYGMKDVFCEAFTGGNDPWRESPFTMKPCGDQAFCDGLTRPCIHGYTISPWLEGAPGVVYWAGTYFNRHITWWDQAPAYLTYLARCSYLLRQGVFAADVAYYTVDGIGKPVSRKAAYGELAGRYDYDRTNSEILLTRMSVKDGRIVLPDGLSYRLLVLAANEALPVEVLRKLAAMVKAGATIVGTRPPGPYGMTDDPAEFTALADQLWGAGQPGLAGEKSLGKGRVVWGRPVLQLLHEDGVPPDVEFAGVSPKGVLDWIHRKTGEGDLYFVCSRWQPVEQVECTFRVSDKIPELWDPVTGKVREAGAFRQEHGRTIVPLRFDPCGSLFVLFRKPTAETVRKGINWLELKPLLEIAGPWTVGFDPKWGGPPEAHFATLADWTTRAEDGIKYYSGKATYRNTFALSVLPKSTTYLDLGTVREVAAVRLNGKELGVLWTKPFRVDITAALQPGANRLEIDVVNLWPNRLTGDTFLPKEKRFTRTNMAKYTQASQLLPSGLLGPVTLQTTNPTGSP